MVNSLGNYTKANAEQLHTPISVGNIGHKDPSRTTRATVIGQAIHLKLQESCCENHFNITSLQYYGCDIGRDSISLVDFTPINGDKSMSVDVDQ